MTIVRNLDGDLTRDELSNIQRLYAPNKAIKRREIYMVGARVKLTQDYDDRLNDIYLEKGEEIEILDTSNNHVVGGQEGEVIGHIPKSYLEGYIDVNMGENDAPRLSSRNVLVKPEKWTVQVHGEMTVMNKDELAKLNQVYKGSLLAGDDRLQNRQQGTRKNKRKRRTSEQGTKTTQPDWVTNVASEFKVPVLDDIKKRVDSIPEEPEIDEYAEIARNTRGVDQSATIKNQTTNNNHQQLFVRFSDAKPEEIPEMHHESDTPRETPEAEPESRKDRLRRKRRANIQMTP